MQKLSPKRKAAYFVALLILFATLGLADSVTIHLKALAYTTDPTALRSCSLNQVFDCVSVSTSRYSKLFGIPVALIGVMYYEAILVMALTIWLGFRLLPWQKWGVSLVVAFSVFFSYYLMYMSYFGIGTVCLYCLVSLVAATGIAVAWFFFFAVSRYTDIRTTGLPE